MAWGCISVCVLSVASLLCAFEEDSKLERLKRKVSGNLLIIRKEPAVKKIANETLDLFLSYSSSVHNYQQEVERLSSEKKELQGHTEQLRQKLQKSVDERKKEGRELQSMKQQLSNRAELQTEQHKEKSQLRQELSEAQSRAKKAESELTLMKQHFIRSENTTQELPLALTQSESTDFSPVDTTS